MNKKFSTLMVGALLTASMGVTAQLNHPGVGEIPYRTDLVKSAVTSFHCNGISKIDPNQWYQLSVTKGMDHDQLLGAATRVLTMERNYNTGQLHLEVKDIEKAALTHSLWKIKFDKDLVSGKRFTLINKETGYELTYDHIRGIVIEAGDAKVAVANAETTVLDGCNNIWEWYTTDEQFGTSNQDAAFQPKLIYAYFHKTDSVMAMAENNNGEVVLVKASKKTAKDDLSAIDNLISLQPVMAGAKVLSAAEVNTMIDADNSYLDFVAGVSSNTSDRAGKLAKFKFNVDLASNPLLNGYMAEASAVAALTRNNYGSGVGTDVIVAGQPSVYAGYDVLFKKTPTEYLQVTTTYHESTTTGNYNGLKLEDAIYANTAEINSSNARYHFKVTYYPTNDSLAIEPLNAAMPNKGGNAANLLTLNPNEYFNTINAGIAYGSATGTPNCLFNKAAGVPVALAAMNFAAPGVDASKVLTVSVPFGINADDATFATECKEAWNCSASSHATDPANPANPAFVTFHCDEHNGDEGTVEYQANMGMKVTFDNKYTYLARASKVDGTYFIRLATSIAATQGEKRVNDSYIVSDFAGHMYYDVKENEQVFEHMPATQWVINQLGCLDKTDAIQINGTPRVKITNREFANVAFEGQLYNVKDAAGNIVSGKYYFIDHFTLPYVNGLKGHGAAFDHLSCGDTIYFENVENPTRGYLDLTGKQITDTTYVFNLIDGLSNEMFLTASMNDTLTVGTTAVEFQLDNVKNVTANGWAKNIYNLKIKDANQIDNDYKYIALDQNHKFVAKYKQDIDKDPTLTLAWFAFKEDAHTGSHYYAMILTDASGVAQKVLRRQPISNEMKIDDLCSSQGTTTTTIFDIQNVKRHIYVQLPAENVYVPVNIQKEPYQAFLYEDFSSAYSVGKGMGYVGVQPKNVTPTAPSVYVDLAKADDYRPLYMFVVNPDSVPAYKFCKDGNIEAPHGLNPSCGHEESYEGYLTGRFMINLQDSVDANINKIENANKFKHNNKTRLAFVEAVHQGNKLYILKDNYTLAMQPWDKAGSKTVIAIVQNGHKYINPKYFVNNEAFKAVIDVTAEDNANRAGFALRRVGFENDGTSLANQFYLETAVTGYGSFSGDKAAWLKEEDGVAVLAQKANANGNHDGNEGAINEGINQATPFTFNFKDATAPTDNEDMTATTVKVIATEGGVIVEGAQGKKVVISNVLGQTVANTVVTSDNVTISAPAGFVTVAIEGEVAVKAIVK